MKKLFGLLLTIILFTSCTKQDNFIAPTEDNNSQLFFKDANLAVRSILATASTNASIKIDFSTLYEKNITKIELMSGETPNYLCAIYTVNITINSSQLKNYSTIEDNPKSQTMYYMIRYTLANGDWGYTNILKFQRNKM
ncbi:MAG: hypothetical protein KF781_06790 [Chitinophagaceae bacterium]|nr:hypothetical protein [Chitinophagaceae bacterium]MCW5904072.1 hypothetical protein [Chitinophagaceae bacterium]